MARVREERDYGERGGPAGGLGCDRYGAAGAVRAPYRDQRGGRAEPHRRGVVFGGAARVQRVPPVHRARNRSGQRVPLLQLRGRFCVPHLGGHRASLREVFERAGLRRRAGAAARVAARGAQEALPVPRPLGALRGGQVRPDRGDLLGQERRDAGAQEEGRQPRVQAGECGQLRQQRQEGRGGGGWREGSGAVV